jgi:hypothetical protein
MKAQGECQGQGEQILTMTGNQCVWMKNGVVKFKTCENAFDCTSCPFDKNISGNSKQKVTTTVNWRQAMRQPHLHKECRHMLTGRVLFKLCSHNYECQNCAYDQQLYEYDQFLSEENLPSPAVVLVNRNAGLTVPLVDSYCAV